jgi:regulator of protease activity HflC (stomatin/prohibitin superfamily)
MAMAMAAVLITTISGDTWSMSWNWFNVSTVVTFLMTVLVIMVLYQCLFTIHTKQAGVVESFGKFSRIAQPGINFKIPFAEKLVYVEDLNMQLMDVSVVSKTKDDATITIPVRVQYYVLPDKVKEAYYELDDPENQIKAHVENVILGHIPKIDLDDTYMQEDLIASRVKEQLTSVMARFGYSIENALVTKIIPSNEVIQAMNNINAARREKVATEAKAEANKILVVKEAEANKAAQILEGEGIAGERKAIIEGLKESVLDFEEGVKDVTSRDVMALVMMTQYFDALRAIGEDNTTILMPHSPSAAQEIFNQLRSTITTGDLAARGKQG